MRAGRILNRGIYNARRREGVALVRSPGTNDANLPCKSRHISRHRAAEGRSCASRFCHPFSPSVLARPPARSSAAHHSANPSEVDEKFSELLSLELSRHAPTTSRKFHDVNAIAIRSADRISLICAAGLPSNLSAVSQTAAGFCQHRGYFYARAFVRLIINDCTPA